MAHNWKATRAYNEASPTGDGEPMLEWTCRLCGKTMGLGLHEVPNPDEVIAHSVHEE